MARVAARAGAGVMRCRLPVAVLALGFSVFSGPGPALGQEPAAAEAPSAGAPPQAGDSPAEPLGAGRAAGPADRVGPPATAAAPDGAPPIPARHLPQHLSPQQVLEARVRGLSRALKLDASQQSTLRTILEEQQLEVRKLRESGVATHRDLSGALGAVLERTRERIRAILTDEQRAGYQVPVPRDLAGPAQADLDHWLKLIQSPPQNARAAN